jgi:hypothetical protein
MDWSEHSRRWWFMSGIQVGLLMGIVVIVILALVIR